MLGLELCLFQCNETQRTKASLYASALGLQALCLREHLPLVALDLALIKVAKAASVKSFVTRSI